MKVIGRLIRLIGVFWKWVLLSVVLGWATVVSWFALIGTSAYLISYAALQPSIAELQVAIVGVRFFGIFRGVFRYLERLVSHTATFKILTEMRVKFFESLEKIVPAGIKDQNSGDLLARIVDDIEILQEFYIRVVYPPFVALLSSIAVLWFFGAWSLKFSVAIFSFQLIVGIILPGLVLLFSRSLGNDLVQNGADIRTVIVDGLRGLDEISAFGIEGDFKESINALGLKRISMQRKMHLITGMQNGFIVLAINLCIVVLLFLTIPMVNNGNLDGKLLAVVILGALASFEAVMQMPSAMQNIGTSLRAGRRLSSVLDEEAAVPEKTNQLPPEERFSLEVRNLSFYYPGTDTMVLDGINFVLPPGKKIGIVGVSGIGKTTIINLLLRHWEFSQGNILLNGIDIRKYSPELVRDKISIVDQQVYLFNTSIMGNLRLGNPTASEQDVIEAAKAAAAHEFIVKLPDGYKSVVGEQGAFLSGGEIQRLGIARALLKNASLYLLDEPLAHLDPILQREIMSSVLNYLSRNSVILVTHQLVGLSAMDEIILIDHGKVSEHGTHTGLLRSGGVYSDMWLADQDVLNDR